MIRAAAKNHAQRRRRDRSRASTAPCSHELRDHRRPLGDATRARARARRLPPHRAVRRGHRRASCARRRHARRGGPARRRSRIRCGWKASASCSCATARTRTRRRPSIASRAAPAVGLAAMTPLHGPELGYNNLLDFSAALALLLEFDEPAAVVIKHTNPCGAALGRTVGEAMAQAKACDPVSIYGGIVGVNRHAGHGGRAGAGRHLRRDPVRARPSRPTRSRSCGAPRRSAASSRCPAIGARCPARLPEYRSVLGGLLVQSADLADLEPAPAQDGVAGARRRAAELTALRFAWRVAKHAKSNAIVLTTARPGGRRGRRPDEPRRLRAPRRHARARDRARRRRARCAPPTRSSRSATARRGRPGGRRPR